MVPSSFEKQPWEVRQIVVDFSNALSPGDTVASISGITAWESTTERTSTVVHGSGSIVGNRVYLTLKAGTDAITYDIRIRVITTNGDQIEEDLSLVVKEQS
jgi:hypothetical protein